MLTDFDSEPSITIGMPVKDRVDCIVRVLKGLENLDYPNSKIKLVFVDGFSLDGTYEILVNWTAKNKEHFKDILLVRKESNIPQARNICINNSHGDYFLFWDSDVVPPDKLLRKMLTIMNSNRKVGIIESDYFYEHKYFFTKMLGQPQTNKEAHHGNLGFALIRMQIFKIIGVFNESLSRGEDEEFVLRLAEHTDYKSLWAPEPVLHLKAPASFRQIICGQLNYSFYIEGEKHVRTFSLLPLFLKLKLFYFGLLPIIIILTLFTIFYINVIYGIMLLNAYLLSGTVVAMHKSSIRQGIVVFFVFGIPSGTAISYGALRYLVKRCFERLKKD